jgi:hypothetical protein
MAIALDEGQLKAIEQMKNGCILCGGVGSGKSRTALVYYYTKVCDGEICINGLKSDIPPSNVKDLYIITTAKKRDTHEWEKELEPLGIDLQNVTIDSWNNIKKYTNVMGAFFMFDEQRVVGYGAWTKAFLRITKLNEWVLLSATPGDTWLDYIPVFIANGFYKNKTEFIQRHVIYNRYTQFPKVDKYLNTGRLLKLRQMILVNIDYIKKTRQHHFPIIAQYDKDLYNFVAKNRWDIYQDEPIQNISGLCYLLRKIVNSDSNRIEEVEKIVRENPKTIIFYNFDYELELLRAMGQEVGYYVAEWNGHKHMPIPDSPQWIYLVQYTAGAEGWNCIDTNVIIFYSQNYSYKTMVQAAGRIDRRNTPFSDLYYYHIKSNSSIDMAIANALNKKKKFNERGFVA